MPITIVLFGILILVLLIGYFKLDGFISFIVASLFIGISSGLPIDTITKAIQDGIGNTLGFLVIILGLGAMLGKLVAESGAAQQIANSLIAAFPSRYVQWAVVLTGFIVGIPMFYSVGFVILVPLVFTIAATTRLPLLYIGLPMLSALSVTHGYLPPHPAPTALVVDFGADMSRTLLYGLIVAVPAIIIGGPLFGQTLKKYNPQPLKSMMASKTFAEAELPSLTTSIFTAMLPVILLLSSAVIDLLPIDSPIVNGVINFIGNPVIAMLLTVLIALYTLGIRRGLKIAEVSAIYGEAVKGIAVILLIIAGAGALKEILIVSDVSSYIGERLQTIPASPLLLAWGIAAVIRVCVGSATVAGLTSAGIVLPLIASTGADPNLMVLATGAGSLMFSHVNDAGFWMFKEFFNMTVIDTLKTWSVMETIVSVVGLLGVLTLNGILH